MDPRIKLSARTMEFQSAPEVPAVSIAADVDNATEAYTLTLPGAMGFSGASKRVLAADAMGFLSFLPLTDTALQSGADASGGSVSIGANSIGFDVSGNAVTLAADGSAAVIDVPLATTHAFRGASDGAPGIVDDVKALATGVTVGDTVANAFAKVDNWLFERVIGQPPAATFRASERYASGFTIAWTPPAQYTIALGSTVPVMTTLNAEISGAGITKQTFLTTQAANMPDGASPITAINFTTNVGQSLVSPTPASTTLTLRNGAGAASSYTLVMARATVVGLDAASGPFTVRVWYTNKSSGAPFYLSVANATKAEAVAPNAPTTVTASTVANALTGTSSVPTQAEAGTANTGTSPGIASYRYAYTTAGAWSGQQLAAETAYPAVITTSAAGQPAPRRDGVTFTDASGAATNAGTSSTFSGLAFDAPYAVTVAASNTAAPAVFGAAGGPAYARTALPTYTLTGLPGSALAFTGTQFGTQGVTVVNRSATSKTFVSVYDLAAISTQLPASVTSAAFALIAASRPGLSSALSGGFASRFTLSLTTTWSGLAAALVTAYAGYGGSTTLSASDADKAITVTSVADAYSGDAARAGFYMQAGGLSVALLKGMLRSSDAPVSATLTHDLSGGSPATVTLTSPDLYFDTLAAPTVSGLMPTAPTPSVAVSGVTIVSNASDVALPTNVDVSALGSYFVPTNLATAAVRWNGGTLDTATATSSAALYKTDDSAYAPTTAITESVVRIKLSPKVPAGNATVFTGGGAALSNLLTGFNIRGSASATLTDVSGKPLYLDMPTLATRAAQTGVRVESGTGTYPSLSGEGAFGAAFDETANLAVAYTQELQLANGLIQTKAAAQGGYKNYGLYSGVMGPEYSSISASGKRYVTFKYTFPAITSGNAYSYATLTLSGAGGADLVMGTNGELINNVSVQLKLVTANGASPWYDANTINPATNINAAGVGDSFPILNAGKPVTLTSRPLIVPDGTGSVAFTAYLRLGLDMSKAQYVRNIGLAFSST